MRFVGFRLTNGRGEVFVNPRQVAFIKSSEYSDHHTLITFKSGREYRVERPVADVRNDLERAE